MFRRRHPVVQKPSSKQQRIWFYLVLPPFTKKACLKIFFFRGREISQRLYNIYSRACCKAPRSWISCWFSAFPSNPSREFMRFLKKIKIVQIYITRLAPNFFYTIKTFSVCLKTVKKILRFLNIFHRILIFFYENRIWWEALYFGNFDHSLTIPGVMWGPTQNVGPIGSAVLTFIGYKQTDRQVKYINRLGRGTSSLSKLRRSGHTVKNYLNFNYHILCTTLIECMGGGKRTRTTHPPPLCTVLDNGYNGSILNMLFILN